MLVADARFVYDTHDSNERRDGISDEEGFGDVARCELRPSTTAVSPFEPGFAVLPHATEGWARVMQSGLSVRRTLSVDLTS